MPQNFCLSVSCTVKSLKGYVKERGLGTPATRASIIEELISAGYIERKDKLLLSTEYGRAFSDSLPDAVTSADMTARWEQMLSDIEHGEADADCLLREIGDTVIKIVQLEKNCTARVPITRNQVVGDCPRCGQSVYKCYRGYACAGGRERCGFFIFGHDRRIGRSYTVPEIRELLATSSVTLKNCISSKGRKYSAVFVLEDTGQYVNLKLLEFVNEKNGRTAG